MEIDFPENWTRRTGSTHNDKYLAKNTKTGVVVGYHDKRGDSYNVWVGNHARDYEVITVINGTREEVKLKALQFMQNNPEYKYEA